MVTQSIRLLLPSLLLSAGAPAAPPSSQALDGVLACRRIVADAQRLVCFDKAAAALDAALGHHDLTVLDREEVRRTRRSLFGFTLPNLQLFGVGDKASEQAPEATTLDGKIMSVRSVSYGKWDMELEEHAVWRNVDLLDSAPEPGDKVRIKKSLMGSFILTIGGRSVHATRVR